MTTTDLTDLAAVIAAYDQARAEADKWTKSAEVLRKRIEEAMGQAEEATVAGLPAFTWRRTGAFNARRFTTDHPDLATKYTRPVTREELDTEALAAEHTDLFTAYRGRRFLREA